MIAVRDHASLARCKLLAAATGAAGKEEGMDIVEYAAEADIANDPLVVDLAAEITRLRARVMHFTATVDGEPVATADDPLLLDSIVSLLGSKHPAAEVRWHVTARVE